MQYLLLGIYLFFTTSGLVLMKLGNNAGTIAMAEKTVNFSINIISLVGLVFYVISFLLYTKIVTTYDLSYIIPITSGIVQILSLLAAIFIFKEQITIPGFIGIAMIIVGIVIMNIKR